MITEEALQQAIDADPRNEQHYLVYADWLEEQGDPRSQAIRRRCLQFRRIEEKLQQLRAVDTGFAYFGSGNHRYQLRPPLPIDSLKAFESQQGLMLPEEYREFLVRMGDGGAGPYYGLLPLEAGYEGRTWLRNVDLEEDWAAVMDDRDGDLARPFPVERPWGSFRDAVTHYRLPAGSNLGDGCLILAGHGCGYHSLLVVTGPQRGMVWDEFLAADGGVWPTRRTFLAWYESWLAQGLLR